MGKVENGVLAATLHTDFVALREDRCRWQSVQTITGNVANGGKLNYAYTESLLSGQTPCYSACTATAKLDVSVP